MSDYISRESVLNTIENMDKALDTDRTVEEYKALLIECIKALPSRDSITELEKIRVEINEKIEQEEFARSVFRHEEKDTVKAEQCTGSIMAYKNVIILFDKYKAESELKGENNG